jgi:hypothetical protein
MILSRSNLLAVQATSKGSPILNNVHVAADGSTVAFDGRALLAISPVNETVKAQVPLTDSGPIAASTISSETVREVLRGLPIDKKYRGLLEHCDLSAEGVFSLTDGKRSRSITAKLYNREFVDYKAVLRKGKSAKVVARVVLNRERLANLLTILDKACPDASGEAPVFLEFTAENDLVMRAANPITGQRAIAYMTSYKAEEGKWLEENEWERALTDGSTKPSTTPTTARRAVRRESPVS